MSERNDIHPNRSDGPARAPVDRDTIARLLRLAGPRPSVPEVAEQRVRTATHEAWRESVASTRRRRRYIWAAAGTLAATLLIALLSIPGQVSTTAPAVPFEIATLQSSTGVIHLLEEGRAPRPLRAGETLLSGMRIETKGDTRAALELVDGGSLRLDQGTQVALVDHRVLELERGGLYFDSAEDEPGADEPGATATERVPALEIRTQLGVIQDIGTQFEVRLADGAEEGLAVRVREGLINLDHEGDRHEAGVGVELRVNGSGELSRHESSNFGPSWDWILDVATPFTLEGQTLEAFLAWVSRETGWETEFVDSELAAAASSILLEGSIEGHRPDRAPDAVLPTCGLEYRLVDGVLLIEAETR